MQNVKWKSKRYKANVRQKWRKLRHKGYNSLSPFTINSNSWKQNTTKK